ncbi:hypothetical protein KCU95_g3135, partial [Aureobasidium melanogenum]
MSNNQHNHGRTGSAAPNYTPLSFGEHENKKDMWVDHLRAAGTAPTVLRGGQMSAETATSVEVNHILISDPAWVTGMLEAPVMGSLPLLPQPVTYLPGHNTQADYYPASTQAAQYCDGMQDGAGYNSYAHYPGAGQASYAYGNSAVTYPTAHSITNHAFQGADSNSWDTYPAPAAPMMPYTNPAAAVSIPRRSRSPAKHQNFVHRRRSPPYPNPISPSFAPSALGHQPFYTGYPTVQSHNLAAYGVVGRRGAWKFSSEAHAATPYQTRLQEARVLAGSQRRFNPGSDDVRNHLPSGSSAASNEENTEDGENESDEVEDAEEEEDEAEEEEAQTDHSNEEEEDAAPTNPIPRKRQGKVHAGNARISCDECRRKHIKCVRPNLDRPCIGCLRAHRGPKVCKITKGSST